MDRGFPVPIRARGRDRACRRSLLGAAVAALVPAVAAGRATAQTGPGVEVDVEPISLLAGLRLPPPPLVLALARVTLPPGVATDATTVAGARLIVVERGTVSVLLAGPMLPAVGPAPVGRIASGPDGAVGVRQGDALALPAAAVEALGNAGPAPAVVLDAAVFPAGDRLPRSFIAADGADVRMLAVAPLARRPDDIVDFVLRRVVLPPGTALPPPLGDGIALLWVERGRLSVEVAAGTATVAVVAGPVGPTGSPRSAAAGATAFLPAGSFAAAPLGTTLLASATPGSAATVLVATLHRPGGVSPDGSGGQAAAREPPPLRRPGELDDPGAPREPRPRTPGEDRDAAGS